MLNYYKGIALILLSCLLSLSCNKNAMEYSDSIIFTANTMGYTEHCGCKVKRGGMAERATLLKKISKNSENVFILDAGNSISSIQVPSTKLLELYESLDYDAYFITAYEYRKLVKFFASEIENSPVLFSSFTLLNKDGKQMFKPYIERTVNGENILFISLTGHTNIPSYYEDMHLMDKETAKKGLKELAGQYDGVFLITDFPRIEYELFEMGVKNIRFAFHLDLLHEKGRVKINDAGGVSMLLPSDGQFFWHIGFLRSPEEQEAEERFTLFDVRDGLEKDKDLIRLMEK